MFAQDRPEQRGLHSMCRFVITNHTNQQHFQQSSEQATSSTMINLCQEFLLQLLSSRDTHSAGEQRGDQKSGKHTQGFHLQLNIIGLILGTMAGKILLT